MVVAADGTPIYPPNSKTPPARVQSPCAAASSSSCSSPTSSSDYCGAGAAPYSSLVLEYPQPRPSPPSSWSALPPSEPQDEIVMDVMHDFDAFETDVHNVSVPESQTEATKEHRRRRRRESQSMRLSPPSSSVSANKIRLPASTKGASLSPVLTPRALKSHHPVLAGKGPQALPRAQKQHAHTRRRDKTLKCPVGSRRVTVSMV